MGKKRINVTIDEEVHKAARKEGFNISKVCEKALKRKVELLRKGKAVEKANEGVNPNNNETSDDEEVVGPENFEPRVRNLSYWQMEYLFLN